METGVYCIRNTRNNKRYVGSAARSFAYRWGKHLEALRGGYHHSRHLQAAWLRYGSKAFKFEILERCEGAACVLREQFWIDTYKVTDGRFGYNVAPKAGSTLGLKLTEEQCREQSQRLKGRKLSEEHKRKIGAGCKGKRISEHHKARISAAQKGKKRTAKQKRHLSQMWTGCKRPDEVKKRIGDTLRGKTHSQAYCDRLSKAKKKHAARPERREVLLAQLEKGRQTLRNRVVWIEHICIECGKPFKRRASQGKRTCCGYVCRGKIASKARLAKWSIIPGSWHIARGLKPPGF